MVHNGVGFYSIKIGFEHVGYKFGEFAFTKQSNIVSIHIGNKFERKKKE